MAISSDTVANDKVFHLEYTKAVEESAIITGEAKQARNLECWSAFAK